MPKILLLLLLVPITFFGFPKKGKYTKTKTINKSFKVNKNATLEIVNKYGNIILQSWDKNSVEITVIIKTNGNDENKTESRLNDISIQFNANYNYVNAITKIKKQRNSWFSGWTRSNNVNVQITYQIKMPVTNHLKLVNDYGNIIINKTKGDTDIDLDYGELNIGELLSTSNYINMDYAKNSNIDYIKEGEIDVDYTSLEVGESEKINLNTDYSNISFNSIKHLNYDCDYGSLKVNHTNVIIGDSDYNRASIKNIIEKGVFSTDYGNLNLETTKTFSTIELETTYTRVKIKTDQNTPFNIEANLNYSGFKYDEDEFTFNKEIIKSSNKYYLGYHKSKNTNSKINIDSSYGSITLY